MTVLLGAFEKDPLVSVAIITYNQKEYLHECIESVLDQDYENIEIVVADDCSTDGTQVLLNDYKDKHPGKFVLLLAEKNQGITRNSNVAHFACSGKYIAWMGGDDLMLQGKIRKQVEFMEVHPDCTICYHNLDVFDTLTKKTLYKYNQKIRPHEGFVDVVIKYGTFNGACSSMVRRENTPIHGFNELLPVASDWLYWVESLLNGGEIRYIPEELGRHRRHYGNITRKSSEMLQGTVDHMNTCNIILAKAPVYFKQVIFRYAWLIGSSRFNIPYVSSLVVSLKLKFNIKYFIALMIYFLSFGRSKF